MQAGELDSTFIGSEVSYGPGMMFSGQVEEVAYLTCRAPVDADQMPPPRIYLRTADGRCASLALDQQVQLKYDEEEGESG